MDNDTARPDMSQNGHKHYRLVDKLQPQSLSDVKCVIAIGESHIASASRDTTVNLWKRGQTGETSQQTSGEGGQTAGGQTFNIVASFAGHGEYVNALAHITDGTSSLGFLASGGNDTLILIHDLDTLNSEATHCLVGHTGNVCALNYDGKLLSGSWDCTARVWEYDTTWKCALVLEGHEQAVWDVVGYDGKYLTADCSIRLWSDSGETLQRFKSPEPVRSLALLPNSEFASASNDGLIRIWESGSTIATLKGHTDYVYDVEWGNGVLLSCGEDKTLRIWDNRGSLMQTLVHDCTSVWSVCSASEYVVTAGSDGWLRVWGPGAPGESDEAGAVNDSADRCVGSDRTAPANSTTDSHGPQGDDHSNRADRLVIAIDYADDQSPLQLIHDRDQNPRTTAEAFVAEHKLSENYISRIEEFIQSHL